MGAAEVSEMRKHVQGISAPMPSELTQNVQLLAKEPNNAADDLLSMT